MGRPFQETANRNTMKIQKTAYIIDAYSTGSYHEVINQGYLMMISELYNEVIYIADKSSCENIRKLLKYCNVRCENVKFQEKNIRFSHLIFCGEGVNYLLKLMKVSLLNYWYYVKTPRGTDVFYNNNLFFAILFISLFAKKNKKIFSMCHNEMELIDSTKANSSATRLLSSFFRMIFCKLHLNEIFHFILLSPKMVEYFSSFVTLNVNKKRLFSIDHAYIRPNNEVLSIYKIEDTKIKIGIPGAINKSRGLDSLKEIIQKLKNKNICIYALSDCSECIESPQFVQLNKGNGLLPFEQYNAYVCSMDAMLLLYDTKSYKLTASGAILEAIWNEKPIIALKNAYFEYLFKKFGDMGILCNTVEELCMQLEIFENRQNFRESILKAKKTLVPNSVKKQLKEILDYDGLYEI